MQMIHSYLQKDISADDEPDLWQKNLGGDIEVWIDIGQPDEKRIKKSMWTIRESNNIYFQKKCGRRMV